MTRRLRPRALAMPVDRSPQENGQRGALLGLAGWGGRSSLLRGLALLALTGLVFFLLFRQIELRPVLGLLGGLDWRIWCAATLLILTIPVVSSYRWHLLLKALGYRIGLGRCFTIIIGIFPLSAISPSKAGDVLKAFSLRREIDPMVVAGSVLAERTLDLLTLSIYALLGGLYFQDARISMISAALVLAIVAALALAWLGFLPGKGGPMRQRLERLMRSLRSLAARPGYLAAVALLTAFNWLAAIFMTFLFFGGVGAQVPLIFTAAALPLAIFVGLLPVTIGGMGTRDGAMVYLFSAFAAPAQAMAVGLLYSFFAYWLLALLGLPFMKGALRLHGPARG